MRADRALVSAFCLQKQKPVSLLELCSASALYSFCKRVVWILSAVYYAHFFMWKKKKNPWKLLPHNIVCPLISLDLLIWPFELYQQNDFLQNWTNIQIKATTTKRISPGGIDRAPLAFPSLSTLFLHQEGRSCHALSLEYSPHFHQPPFLMAISFSSRFQLTGHFFQKV